MIEIIPAILTNNPEELREMVDQLNDVILPNGVPLKRIQIDINDGHFLNNKTIDPGILVDIETGLELDFHLMTKEPIDWVEKCVRGGADRIIGQIETMQDQFAFIGKVQEVGAEVGLALDIDTEIERIDEMIIGSLDVILLMSYPAGAGGQKFNEKVLDKIRFLNELRMKASGTEGLRPGGNSAHFKICVDGGITTDNIKSVKMIGADEVAVGKRLFAGDIEANLEKYLKNAY